MKNLNNFNQKRSRGLLIWIISGIVVISLWSTLAKLGPQSVKQLKFSEFLDLVKDKKIHTADFSSNVVTGKMDPLPVEMQGGNAQVVSRYETAIPLNYPDLVDLLRQGGVDIEIEKITKSEWASWLSYLVPFILIIFFWMFMMRQQAGGKNFTFGKSKARMFSGEKGKVTFKDVAGVEEAKEELEEIIEFLKEPKKFQRLGGKIPKGVLLVGSPGSGKTLLAKAIAGEANVPFFSISGSDFVELFVGVGASRVRDLFEEGKKHSPCIIFIDEIDAVGRQRGAGLGGGHDEREQTLNQLLVEMDGFDANEGIIIVAATNRPDILDSALLRPGRFDRRVVVSTPDVRGREEILRVHTRKTPLAKGVDLKVLARSTPGFSGADLANMVNEAALYASRKGKKKVTMKDFEFAKDKVMMGAERRSMIISEEEKKITAYHEAGHALIAALAKEADPLHKVSIIPRGMALGVTQQLPLNDKYTYSKVYLEAQLQILLAGRISEEVFLNTKTTGAGNDFERATSIARKMVCEWGMSSLGPRVLGRKDDMVFLGRDLMHQSDYSNETARLIDEEIGKIIDTAYKAAREIIETHREKMEIIAQALLERESLSADDIQGILNGESLKVPADDPSEDVEDASAD